MSVLLKQSTSADVPIGPFVDSTDGVTPETALTITQPDVRLKKNAAAWAQKAAAQTLAHEENGYYEVTLDATDTDTLGRLRIAVNETGALPVWQDFMVVAANVYDSLIGGGDTLDVQVTGIGANVITAASINADAITDAKVASDVTIASVTGAVGSVTGNVGGNVVGSVAAIATGGIVAASFAAGAIDASAIAANAIGASELAADAATEIAAAVRVDLTTELGRIDVATSTRASQTSVDTLDNFVDTEVDAIKAVTDKLAGMIELGAGSPTYYRYNTPALELAPTGGSAPSAGVIADAVWDELLAGHAIGGSAGAALSAAGTAGDPWSTALPGAYGAGTAGKIVGDNVNATISSRAVPGDAMDLVTDAVDANAVAASGVTEIQSGLATSAAIVTLQADADDLQTRLPAALVGGRIDASVGAMAAAVLTAASIAADAITDAKVAADVTIASVTGAVGSVTGAVGSVTGAIGSIATGGIVAASFAAGAIDASAIAADAIGSSELAASAATEIAAAVRVDLATELARIDVATGTRASQVSLDAVDDFVDTEIAAIKVVTDKLNAMTELGVGSPTYNRFTVTALELAPTGGSAPSAATIADAVWDEARAGHVAGGSFGEGVATVSGAVGSVTGNVGGNVAGSVASVTAGVTVTTVNDKTGYRLSATGVDDMWDEAIAGHLAAGSTGKALNDATSAGNPWNSVLEGVLTAGDLLRIQAGVAVGKTDIIDNGNGTAHVEFRDASDLSLIVAADMTGSERTAVTLTP